MLKSIASFATTLNSSDIPQPSVASAKVFLADTLACALAGSASTANDAMATAFTRQEGEYSLPGRPERVSRDNAAIMTAHAIHCLEWDAVHEPAVVHAMSVTTGALWAECQSHNGISGIEFLTAITVGVDIASRLGIAAEAPLRFFRPATAGLLGATAAVARMRGLSESQTAHAISLGYSQVHGTMQAHLEGTPTLAVQVALSARAALNACDMAQAGMTGPSDIFNGPFGYFNLIEEKGDTDKAFKTLGQSFAIDDLSIKPYPSGRASHGALSTVLKHLDIGDVTARSFAGMTAYVPTLIHRLVGRPHKDDMGQAYARLCLPFLVGLALRDGRIDPRRFTDADFRDPRIAAVAAKVAIEVDDNPDPNALAPQRIVLRLSDGSEIDEPVPAVLGAPEAKLSAEQRYDKFAFAASIAKTPLSSSLADSIWSNLKHLEQVPDCSNLWHSLSNK